VEVQISQFVPIVSSKLLAYHVIKDERLVSKVEGKTNFFEAPTGCQEPGLLFGNH